MSNGRWYVLHAYSGYEKKVSESIVEQAKKLGISEFIEEVSVPTQNIVEVKRGTRVHTERKFFPGYILIKMIHIHIQRVGQIENTFLGPSREQSF